MAPSVASIPLPPPPPPAAKAVAPKMEVPAAAPVKATTPQPLSAPKPVSKSVEPIDEENFPGYVLGPSRTERAVKINRMRAKISERLKESQTIAASLTTFNEIDMS